MRHVLAAVAWLGAVVLIAFGAAGIVTAMDVPPAAGARPELTARGDARVVPTLVAAEADLVLVSSNVEALGTQARGALAALTASDIETAEAAIAAGDALVATIGTRTAAIADELAGVPLIGTPAGEFELSAGVRARHADLVGALAATGDLDAAWTRLTTGALTATMVSSLLAAHDDAVLDAAVLGRRARYDDAVDALKRATSRIDDARGLRDQLANTVDVSTLDQWLDRNEAYDSALSGLYRALDGVGGRVTDKVRKAIAAERAAKGRLPPDTRGLVLIMSDIGRGGMNGAVITIESTRGRLAAALESLAP